MSDEKNFREELFSAEPISPQRRQRFHDELAQIVEPRLPRSHRLYYLMILISSVFGVFGAVCGLLFDAPHRPIQALVLVVWTAAAAWSFHILRRGSEPLKAMQSMSKALSGIGFLAAGLLIYRGLQSPSLTSILFALLGLLLFLLVSFINLWNRIITSERTVREHLLRVEYRLAEPSAPAQSSPPSVQK